MTPGTHLIASWLVGVELLKERRERTIVAFSGLAPDLDGLGAVTDKLNLTTDLYIKYHHYLGHNIYFITLISLLASIIAKSQKASVFALSFIAMHIHILCDLAGSGSEGGHQWPIFYLYPNSEFSLTWQHQWLLNSWQNNVFVALLFFIMGYYQITKKISILEIFSTKIEATFQNMLSAKT